MKLYYIANARIPTEKAHGIHIMKMCEAFADEGLDVTLAVPKRKNTITDDPYDYYGVSKNFNIEYIPILDLVGNPIHFWLSQLSFSISLLLSPSIKKTPDTVVFSRDMFSGLFLSLIGFPVFFDMHGFPEQFVWFWKFAMKRMKGVVLTNKQKLGRVKSILGILDKKILIYPNGYDPKLFEIKTDKETLRKELDLPKGNIVMYTGHLYEWKGANILAETAMSLPDTSFVFIGGTEKSVEDFKNTYKGENIYFLGHKKYVEIPKYLKVADILILPNSRKSPGNRTTHSLYDTSPIKMFEYMASGIPIVSSNLPSTSEILNENNSILVTSDNTRNLADGIQKVLDYPNTKLTEQAKKDVFPYTWQNRTQYIIEFINEKL